MKYGTFPGIDQPVSRLIQGTAMLVRALEDDALRLLDGVYEAGCTAFDTARAYGNGRAERALGSWLSRRGVRERVVIIDKGGHPDLGGARLSPEALTHDLARSLEHLGVDRIDLYLLHRDDTSVPVPELVDFLDAAVQRGQIVSAGVSNWTHERLAEANAYAERNSRQRLVASSPELSLVSPANTWPGCLSIAGETGRSARDWYAHERVPVLAWSPLAGGFLCGGYAAERPPTNTEQKRVLHRYGTSDGFARLAKARELAARRGVSVAQVALAYVVHAPFDAYATVGTNTAAEYLEDAEALTFTLSEAERAWLEA